MANDDERLWVAFELRMTEFERKLKQADRAGRTSWDSIEARFRRGKQNLDSISSSLGRSLIAPLTGIGAALSTREVLKYADAWTAAKNSLAVAGVTGVQQAAILNELFASAQRNAAPLSALTTLYGRAAQASGELGASQGDLIKFTDGIAVALKVAGTDATQASGALLQLGQALGSAKVQAEEFNSINEGARPILQAVAAGLDAAGGSVSKLKTLVNDGAVSNRDFFQAFLKGLPTIERMAANSSQTIGQAYTKIGNALTRYIGEADESLGATQRLVKGLNALADNFNTTADIVLKVAAVVAAGLVGRAIVPMIASLGLGTMALMNFVGALRAAGSAAGVAAAFGGIARAAGPVGFLIGSVVVGALAVFGTSSAQASAGARTFQEELRKIDDEARKAAPAVTDLNQRLLETQRIRLGEGISAGRRAISEAIDQIERYIQRATAGSLATMFSAEQRSQLEALVRGLKDGTITADDAQRAFRNLGAAVPNFKPISDRIQALIGDIRSATLAVAGLNNQLAAVGAPGALPNRRTSEDASMRAYDDMLRIGRQLGEQASLRNRQSTEELRLTDAIAAIRKKATDAGGSVTLEDARRQAREQIAAEDRRTAEDKSGSTRQRRTVDDAFARDIQAIRDRTAALLLETQTVGKSYEEQERRRMALELEQQTLRRIQDTARQNGDANWRTIQLSEAQRSTIATVSAEYGKQADALRRVTEGHDRARQAAEEFYSTSKTELIDVVMGTKRWDQALLNIGKRLANLALNGLFDSLFKPAGGGGIFASLTAGFGKLLGFADGGQVRGPGTGRSDSILARVSDGEYVVNARATAQHLPLLDAINKGKLPGFADGGRVGPIPTPAIPAIPSGAVASSAGPSMTFAPVITATVNAQGGDPKQNQDLADRMGATLEAKMRIVAMDEMRKAARPGGFFETIRR